ncbi:LPXTG cell wall anchor domain-containing protein, partial [Finegoldia magna]
KALANAEKVLADPNATQEEVDKAKDALLAAEKALNGKATQEVDADKVDPTVSGKTKVKDPSNLTNDEKSKVKEAIEKANKDKFPQGTKVEIGNDGTATIKYPDKSKDTIKGSDLVEKIVNAPTRPSRTNKPAKNLPKAGIESEAMMMAAAALSTLGGLYVSRKKKEDEE